MLPLIDLDLKNAAAGFKNFNILIIFLILSIDIFLALNVKQTWLDNFDGV